MAQYFYLDPKIWSSNFWSGFRLKVIWSNISTFSSKIKKHIMTYISKIHSRNLILDHMLSAVPKISVQMIPKNKDSLTGSFSQKWSFFRLKSLLAEYFINLENFALYIFCFTKSHEHWVNALIEIGLFYGETKILQASLNMKYFNSLLKG